MDFRVVLSVSGERGAGSSGRSCPGSIDQCGDHGRLRSTFPDRVTHPVPDSASSPLFLEGVLSHSVSVFLQEEETFGHGWIFFVFSSKPVLLQICRLICRIAGEFGNTEPENHRCDRLFCNLVGFIRLISHLLVQYGVIRGIWFCC